MRYLLPALLVMLHGLALHGQTFYENKAYGFKMQQPDKWFTAGKDSEDNTLATLRLTKEQVKRVLDSRKGVISLCAYSKYDATVTPGFTPTIKVTIRQNPAVSFQEFKQILTANTETFKTVLDNFVYIQPATSVTISGTECVYTSFRYTLKTGDFGTIRVRARSYSIPEAGYFISVTFMDSPPAEDCTVLFDQLVKTIYLR